MSIKKVLRGENMKTKNYKIEVTQEKIFGTLDVGNELFIVFWERVANSGHFLTWAKNEEEAIYSFIGSPKFCLFTVAKISPDSLPVVCGTRN
jgi:hypothetical protein